MYLLNVLGLRYQYFTPASGFIVSSSLSVISVPLLKRMLEEILCCLTQIYN